MPAASTSTDSVQVPGFEEVGLLTHCVRLLCDFCSSGQCFAFGFLQIPPRGGHPCRSANCSPCRANSGLSPPSHPTATTRIGTAPVTALRAMPGAPTRPFFASRKIGTRTVLAESPEFGGGAKRGLIFSGGFPNINLYPARAKTKARARARARASWAMSELSNIPKSPYLIQIDDLDGRCGGCRGYLNVGPA
jgi:hypothetical protein